MAEVSESPFRPLRRRCRGGDGRRADGHRAGARARRVHHTWHRRLERGYPIPSLHRDRALNRLQPAFKARDVLSRGRFGAWKYEVSNQDHSFAQGVEAVDRWLGGGVEETLNAPEVVNARRPPAPGGGGTIVSGSQLARATWRVCFPRPAEAAWRRAVRTAQSSPRRAPGTIRLLDYDIAFSDATSLAPQWHDIFVRESLAFNAARRCAAHSRLRRQSRPCVPVFQTPVHPMPASRRSNPIRVIAPLLRRNLARNGGADVEVVEAAVWSARDRLTFFSDQADAGALAAAETPEGRSSSDAMAVDSVRLREWLEGEDDRPPQAGYRRRGARRAAGRRARTRIRSRRFTSRCMTSIPPAACCRSVRRFSIVPGS